MAPNLFFRCGLVASFAFIAAAPLLAQDFAQLGAVLPPPSETRLASGAPGPAYWQQEANYQIAVELDEKTGWVAGQESIEYVNHSPHTLRYLWLQLDQNALAEDSMRRYGERPLRDDPRPGEPVEMDFRAFRSFVDEQAFDGGHRIEKVSDGRGRDLPYRIVGTNMRIDLPGPLKSGGRYVLKIEWRFPVKGEAIRFRHGRKRLEGGDYAYQIAQWYPRLCAYYDQAGWQLKNYTFAGEFALEFGSFEVAITVPSDFVVAATGELQNGGEVLSVEERDRLEKARRSDEPVVIVTEAEATERLANPSGRKKTWRFRAENVRDFAFAASRGYIWDAMRLDIDGKEAMAVSVYPKEAMPLWQRYSTEAVAQALRAYSEFVYPYPYPVAWSAWGAEYGMEYPMISFQSTVDIDDKQTYPEEARNYVLRVIMHEIGHNWFPMIINSDERQWMWLDEGLNSFVEAFAGASFDPRLREFYREGMAEVVDTMTRPDDPTIMIAADDLTERGYQAYRKPALGLMVLRDGLMGRELFDFAFREYARRWAFKRATPADFFRTLEDASGVDLDWFWRGWFFGNDHVDMSIDGVSELVLDTGDPDSSKAADKAERQSVPGLPFLEALGEAGFEVERDERLQDWYFHYDRYAATKKEKEEHAKSLEEMEQWQRELLKFDQRVYAITTRNLGGLPVPLVFDIVFEDGSERRLKAPAEIWRSGDEVVKVAFVSDKSVERVELDRENAFADADLVNNRFPRSIEQGRLKLKPEEKKDNPMREALYPEKEGDKDGLEPGEE